MHLRLVWQDMCFEGTAGCFRIIWDHFPHASTSVTDPLSQSQRETTQIFRCKLPSCFKEGFYEWIHERCIENVHVGDDHHLLNIILIMPQITPTWTLTFMDAWTRMLVNSHPNTPCRLPFSVLFQNSLPATHGDNGHQSYHAGSCHTTMLQTLGTCLGGISKHCVSVQ